MTKSCGKLLTISPSCLDYTTTRCLRKTSTAERNHYYIDHLKSLFRQMRTYDSMILLLNQIVHMCVLSPPNSKAPLLTREFVGLHRRHRVMSCELWLRKGHHSFIRTVVSYAIPLSDTSLIIVDFKLKFKLSGNDTWTTGNMYMRLIEAYKCAPLNYYFSFHSAMLRTWMNHTEQSEIKSCPMAMEEQIKNN